MINERQVSLILVLSLSALDPSGARGRKNVPRLTRFMFSLKLNPNGSIATASAAISSIRFVCSVRKCVRLRNQTANAGCLPSENAMPLQIKQERDDIATVQASGELEEVDYEHFTAEFESFARQHGKLRILFDMTGFEGWNAGGLKKELEFDSEHFDQIERLAAVGDKKWEKGLMKLTKPFVQATIKYFDRSEIAAAREWLRAE